jgi:eukaryotic-like serine/threonine-protein kinase
MDDFKIASNVRIDGRVYKIEDSIRGGMGMVLLCSSQAEDSSFLYRNKLAAKIFFPDQSINGIRNELKIWQSLHHPHIAKLLVIGHVNDWLCAAMPWFSQGCITSEAMQQLGGFSPVKMMLQQICSALQLALEKNILHLDVKPGNILSRDNHYVLADWGIAKFSAKKAINKDPSSGGTIPYMAPERFLFEPTNEVADIYSLGMTVFQMLTGFLPFSESNTQDMAQAIVTGQIDKRLRSLTNDMPKNWQHLVLSCCAYESKDRPRNYRQLLKLTEKVEV